MLVAHLEEDNTDKEGGTESEDTDGIKGVTEEFIVPLIGQSRILSRRNAVTTAAAWNILSTNAHW